MSIFSWLGSIFKAKQHAKETANAPQKASSSPLAMEAGGRVIIDGLLFKTLNEKIKIEAPEQLNQQIYSHGVIDIEHGTKFHRFYLDDDSTWIQIVTNGAGSAGIENIVLFRYIDGKDLNSEAEIARLAGPQSKIGLPTYEYEGNTYYRAWGSEEGQTNLIDFDEKVKNVLDESYPVYLKSMLYTRDIEGTNRSEMLIFSVEESESGIILSTAIGISVTESDITVV